MDSQDSIKNKRNNSLYILGFLAAVGGCLNAIFYDNDNILSLIAIVMPLLAIASVYFWIIYDARLRNYRIPKYVKFIIILFGIIGVPIYFWQTRNVKGFIINIGGLWLFIYYYLIYYIAIYITATLFN